MQRQCTGISDAGEIPSKVNKVYLEPFACENGKRWDGGGGGGGRAGRGRLRGLTVTTRKQACLAKYRIRLQGSVTVTVELQWLEHLGTKKISSRQG